MLNSCAISKYKHLSCEKNPTTSVAPVINPKTAEKYKASIDVLKNHLTGLLIVKQTDSITKHLVFVTELGMKMFDLEAKNKELKAVYVFEPLNKPLLIDALVRNFSNIFLLNIDGLMVSECHNKKLPRVIKVKNGKETWYYSSPNEDSHNIYPRLQETFHKNKRNSKIEYLVEKSGSWHYSKITCKQYGLVKFYFELNAILPTND